FLAQYAIFRFMDLIQKMKNVNVNIKKTRDYIKFNGRFLFRHGSLNIIVYNDLMTTPIDYDPILHIRIYTGDQTILGLSNACLLINLIFALIDEIYNSSICGFINIDDLSLIGYTRVIMGFPSNQGHVTQSGTIPSPIENKGILE
ncbi:hypothetical protein ACJX0J_039327, partial [Zea mays]